jgi:hypothetical protein
MTIRVRAAWDLYHEQGWPLRRIARELNISRAAVNYRLGVARRELGLSGLGAGQHTADMPRCKCLLRLPCHRCLPTVDEVAGQRL